MTNSAHISGEQTQEISGPSGESLSPSASLQRSLESRLRVLLDVNGSPEYALTWKHWAMPSGQPICALRASPRRTSGNGCGGWRTPTGRDGRDGVKRMENDRGKYRLQDQAATAGWPTPNQWDAERGSESRETKQARGSGGVNLAQTCKMAGWLTPTALSFDGSHQPGKNRSIDETEKLLAGWGTPTERDHKDAASTLENTPINGLLGRQASLAGWASPSAHGSAGEISEDLERVGNKWRNKKTGRILQTNLATDAKLLLSGATTSLSTAGTEKRGALNPEHSRWLMGYPAEWLSCVDWGTPSSRNSRQRSLGLIC